MKNKRKKILVLNTTFKYVVLLSLLLSFTSCLVSTSGTNSSTSADGNVEMLATYSASLETSSSINLIWDLNQNSRYQFKLHSFLNGSNSQVIQNPDHGEIYLSSNDTSSIEYQSDKNFIGMDHLVFTAEIQKGVKINYQVLILVRNQNSKEDTGSNQLSFQVGVNSSLILNPLYTSKLIAEHTNSEDNSNFEIFIETPTSGLLVKEINGFYTFKPQKNFFGSIKIKYMVQSKRDHSYFLGEYLIQITK